MCVCVWFSRSEYIRKYFEEHTCARAQLCNHAGEVEDSKSGIQNCSNVPRSSVIVPPQLEARDACRWLIWKSRPALPSRNIYYCQATPHSAHARIPQNIDCALLFYWPSCMQTARKGWAITSTRNVNIFFSFSALFFLNIFETFSIPQRTRGEECAIHRARALYVVVWSKLLSLLFAFSLCRQVRARAFLSF